MGLADALRLGCGALCVGSLVFVGLRSTTNVSSRELFRAERRLLQTVRCGVRIQYCSYEYAGQAWEMRWLEGGGAARAAPVPDTRPVIVMVPGHGSQSGQWVGLIEPVFAAGVRLCILDMPGWGFVHSPAALRAARDPDRILQLQRDAIVGWLQHQGLEDVVLVGHSVGGLLVTHVAAEVPHLIRHLVPLDACGIYPFLSHKWTWSLVMALLPPAAIMGLAGRLSHAIVRTAYLWGTREDVRLVDYYAELFAASQTTGRSDIPWSHMVAFAPWTCARRGWWKRPVLGQLLRLARLARLPISLVWAGEDELFPVEFAHSLQGLLGNDTHLYVLEGCLHNPSHNNSLGTALALVDIAKRAAAPAAPSWHDGSDATDAPPPHGQHTLPRIITAPSSPPLLNAARQSWASAVTLASPAVRAPPRPLAAERSLSSGFSQSSTSLSTETEEPSAIFAPGTVGVSEPLAAGGGDFSNSAQDMAVAVGWCEGCGEDVVLHKAYWSCGCGAWTFNYGPGVHPDTLQKLQEFLTALHCDDGSGAFNARGAHKHLVSHHPVLTSTPARLRQQSSSGMPRVCSRTSLGSDSLRGVQPGCDSPRSTVSSVPSERLDPPGPVISIAL